MRLGPLIRLLASLLLRYILEGEDHHGEDLRYQILNWLDSKSPDTGFLDEGFPPISLFTAAGFVFDFTQSEI